MGGIWGVGRASEEGLVWSGKKVPFNRKKWNFFFHFRVAVEFFFPLLKKYVHIFVYEKDDTYILVHLVEFFLKRLIRYY